MGRLDPPNRLKRQTDKNFPDSKVIQIIENKGRSNVYDTFYIAILGAAHLKRS